jgi:hypothetical protein
MRLVEADHRRRVAEDVARDAQQGKLDAEAAAALARSEAEQSSQAATAAREHARTVQAQAAQKERERAAERAAHEQALQQQLAADLAYAPNFEPDEPDRLGGIRPQICLHWAVAPKSTREASRQRARG